MFTTQNILTAAFMAIVTIGMLLVVDSTAVFVPLAAAWVWFFITIGRQKHDEV
jgi:hypothetical protein